MKPIVTVTVFFVCEFALALSAQTMPAPAPTIYAESFRKGPTRVKEASFEAKLDLRNPEYRERIKDSHGNDRYELKIVPQIPEGDDKVTAWRVKLADLHYKIYDNVLLASQEPSSEATNNLFWLNPGQYALAPIDARRIIKVDNFYVVLQVKSYHFTPLESPYLDSMTVDVKINNSDPRNGSAQKESP
jgi:hypothetical protein